MRKMKNSGIEWVGDIPDNWDIHPLYCFFEERINKNIFGKEQNLLSLSYGKIKRKDINSSEGLLPANYNTYNIVHSGDIVIRPTDLQNDKRSLRTGLVEEQGIITSAYIALKPKKNTYSKYFHYLLHIYDVLKVFYNMGNGVRQGLNYDEFSKLLMIIPPIEEQRKIAEFLDEKCGEIDALIADIKTQIESLEQYKRSVITEKVTKGLNPSAEMKDSGIDYIGETPKSWEVLKLKYILSEINIRTVTGTEDLLSVSQYKGVILASENKMRTMQAESLIGYKIVRVDDLIFNKLNPSLARFGCSRYNGITSPDFAVYRSNSILASTKFLEYLLKTERYATQYSRMAGGVGDGFSRLYTNQLFQISVSLPTLCEQQNIVNYIKNKESQIEELKTAKQSQIETLEAYKKSIIYEYVTGKKEVG